jgi:predicted O-methyltransferase YrrM
MPLDPADIERLTKPAERWQDVPGWFNFSAFYDSVVESAPQKATFVEVGCFLGKSLCYLGSAIRRSGKDIALVGVDTCTGSETTEIALGLASHLGGTFAGLLHRNVLSCGLGNRVRLIVADSVSAAALFAPASLDFVFIDGDHSRAAVLADIAAWLPKLKPGGLLAGHDYRMTSQAHLRGVTEAVESLWPGEDLGTPLHPQVWVKRVGDGRP